MDGEDYWAATEARRTAISHRFGVLFQSGALWSSMTVAENVALPLQMFTDLAADAIAVLVQLKLSFVGLSAAADRMPAELSGGMRKRAALARAIALDPEILLFDEPSAGLDPVTSQRLDELIVELSRGLGATVVIVSHELPSLFAIAMMASFWMRTPEQRSRAARRGHYGTHAITQRCRPSWSEDAWSLSEPREATMTSRPAVVGGFILGALALGVAGILFFGGMQLFATRSRVVVFFSNLRGARRWSTGDIPRRPRRLGPEHRRPILRRTR